MASTTLYPPIMDTYMPALVLTEFKNGSTNLKINFAISNFITNLSSINEIQIRMKTQDGETNVFTNSGIYFYPVDFAETDSRNISIEIPYNSNIFTSDILKEDNFYRIQIRFSSKQNSKDVTTTENNVYLTNCLDEFSEWSSIGLIKMIYSSKIVFTKGLTASTKSINYISSFEELNGYLSFNSNDKDTTEYLYSYRIRVYENSDLDLEDLLLTEPLEDSGNVILASYSTNQFSFVSSYDFNTGDIYRVVFDYTTSNNYSKTLEHTFMITEAKATSVIEKYIDKIDFIPNYEKGCVQVHLTFKRPFTGKIVLRRADNRTNYKRLYDLYFDTVRVSQTTPGLIEDYYYEDYTIESGILYRYVIQDIDSAGNRGKKIYLNEPKYNDSNTIIGYIPVMLELDDIFISTYGNVLKLKYDPIVDSYQPNVMDNKVDTIGSKYPFMKRGAAVNYKTFSIGGIISWEGDIFEDIVNNNYQSLLTHSENEHLTKKAIEDVDFTRHLFADIGALFNGDFIAEEYREVKGDAYNNHRDFTIERLFREAVLAYLTDGTVKLFRSPSEGNILVKLTDVSLSPKQELGRMLYTISATATEVDECTIDNYVLYDIIRNNKDGLSTANSFVGTDVCVGDNLEKWNVFEQYIYTPLNGEYTIDFMNYLSNKYRDSEDGVSTSLEKITYVKLDFADYVAKSSRYNENLVAKVVVNGQEMYVSTSYPYLEIEDINIKSLTVTTYNSTSNAELTGHVIIDYKGVVTKMEVFLFSSDITIEENGIGQIRQEIEANTSLVPILQKIYTFSTTNYEQSLLSINKIILQVVLNNQYVQNACFLIKDTSKSFEVDEATGKVTYVAEDSDSFVHLTDKNGLIELYDSNSIFQNIVYNGIVIRDYEEDTNIYKNFEEITAPQERMVYRIWVPSITRGTMSGDTLILNTGTVEGTTLIISDTQDQYDTYAYLNGNWYKAEDGYVKCPVELTFTYFYSLERSELV